MPRTQKPENYPMEFFEVTLRAWRSHSPVEIPCENPGRAASLRTKIYTFFQAVTSRLDGGAEPLARRLASAQRLPPAFDSDPGWEIRAASDIIAAAADTECTIRGSSLWLIPKSQNQFALMVRAALDTQRGSASESLDRLRGLLGPDTPPEGEER